MTRQIWLMNVKANGIYIPEPEMSTKILSLLEKFHPDILVLTGHDALYSKTKSNDKLSYQNSNNYIDAVKESRKYETICRVLKKRNHTKNCK